MYVSLHRVKISLSKNVLLCQAIGKEKIIQAIVYDILMHV